jgi:hypothetical protein
LPPKAFLARTGRDSRTHANFWIYRASHQGMPPDELFAADGVSPAEMGRPRQFNDAGLTLSRD